MGGKGVWLIWHLMNHKPNSRSKFAIKEQKLLFLNICDSSSGGGLLCCAFGCHVEDPGSNPFSLCKKIEENVAQDRVGLLVRKNISSL